MSKQTIVLNSKNKIDSNVFEIDFDNNTLFGKNDKIGLEAISVYNCFFNIKSSFSNNKFTIIWNADTTVEYNHVIENSYKSVSDYNFTLQHFMAQNDLYCIDSNGDIVYFINIETEATIYGTSITCFALPNQANATALGYSKPVSAVWNFPVTDKTPQFKIVDNLSTLLGHAVATFPPNIQSTVQIHYSTTVPQLSINNSIILTCSLLNQKFTKPSNVLSSIPLKSNFGSILDFQNSNPSLFNISAGTYGSLRIEFYDQIFRKLDIIDPDVIIRLVIETNEVK